mmetsp:Transcript_18917/g.39373  ORF Transcript_18917/g.39373 Transcript_18917/m.39373 type:complete len:152 (+) Transcript_18917:19-474(+)
MDDETENVLRDHYKNLGYRVHSGLQFGTTLVLYADSPNLVHSDFAVLHTPSTSYGLDWRRLQVLTRAMPDYHKTLVIAEPKVGKGVTGGVDEIRVKGFHRAFKKRKAEEGVGGQRKVVVKKSKREKKEETGRVQDTGGSECNSVTKGGESM